MKRTDTAVSMSLTVTVAIIYSLTIGCSLPQYLWHEKDVSPKIVNPEQKGPKVLIASSKSAFKEALISNLTQNLTKQQIQVTITGLHYVPRINPDKYAVVVLFNTCMAGQYDRRVKDMIKRVKNSTTCIVMTTAADPQWKMPVHKNDPIFDAISSASRRDIVEILANDISQRIRKKIAHGY
ncbi:MAG: hypothetical protein JW795_08250 [Chitinivibrionales bacterium]|nr:hypothetical protein [Chitinivibrionales bacterium]